MYITVGKRVIDLTVALFGFVLLSPVFVLAAILLFFANQGKPFFFSEAPGKER